MNSVKKMLFIFLLVLAVNITLALNPSKEYAMMPDEMGMDYKEIVINTEDGLRLNAWLFKPMSESKKLIIISDDGDGNMADNLEIVGQFLSMGYHVMTYDYRGYGKSDDFKINPKFYIYPQFVKDITAAINYAKKYHPTLAMDLYGIGIGGGLSIGAGANEIKVRHVIADAPYVTFEQMSQKMAAAQMESVIMPPVYDKVWMEPLYSMQTKGQHLYGLLYIVGENDKLAGPKEIQELLKASKSKGSIYVVKGADNKATFATNKNAYFDQIKKFLAKN